MRAFRTTRELQAISNHVGTETTEDCSVSIFMPARNEAEIIDRSCRGVLEQGRCIASMVVIDDNSKDDTSKILKNLSEEYVPLKVIRREVLEPGVCGKPSALAWAYEQSATKKPWLLFIDADVVLAPGALDYLVRWAQAHKCDMVTGYPEQKLGSWLEKIVMPSVMAFVGAAYPFQKVTDKNSTLAFANGQLILVRREVYENIGGHRAVQNQVLEDVALAKLLKRAGAQLGILDLRGLAETRMYANQSELIEGWSKNLFLLLEQKTLKTILLSVLLPLLGCSGLLALLSLDPIYGFAAFIFVTSMQMSIRYLLKVPVAWGFFSSFGSLYLSFLLLRSLLLHTVVHSVTWKGRRYENAPK